MPRRRYEIAIAAPRERIWHVLLDHETYLQWTRAFSDSPGRIEGDWSEGGEMRFLGVDPETGEAGGMYSRVETNRPPELLVLRHQGIIRGGRVDTTSEEARAFVGSIESYTLAAEAGGTRLVVELDLPEAFVAFMDEAWPQALESVKALAERA